jgi:hypothetical protein
VDIAAPPGDPVLAPAVVALAAGAFPFPLHAASTEAPPAATANLRNARRPGD